jgi:tetratricopeptide (TPR) repeat protein
MQIESALSFISSKHRKHTVIAEDPARDRVPVEVVEMYENLCLEAGDIVASALENGDLLKLVPWNPIDLHLPERDTIPPDNITKAELAFDNAHALIEKNKINEAIDTLELVVSLFPHHSLAQNDLGVLYLANAEYERAVAHLDQARRLTPDNADTIKNLAEAYMGVGRIEDAIQTMLDLVQQQPDDLEALYWLGIACESQGQKRAAREVYSRIQQLQPDHQKAGQRLAALRDDRPSTA